MSDPITHDQAPDRTDAGSDGRASSVGLYLAGQRRLRGISIDDLAARTRIPRRNIERLEAGAFDAAPDGFSRGFVRTVAQALGLDADEAVMHLMTEPQVDESLLQRERRVGMLLRGALAGGVLLIAIATWRLIVAVTLPAGPDAEPSVVYRRDPVKLLAAEQGQQAAMAELRSVMPAAPPDGG